MAELALAIIPIGLKTCSGLLSYVGGIKDRDDAIARLARQIESLEGSFQLLDTFLKRGQLDPATSPAAAHVTRCLKNCEDGLDELKVLEEKLSSSTALDPKTKDKVKDYYRKLSYPLQQTQLRQLENTLDNLCTPLSLAIQNLQLWVILLVCLLTIAYKTDAEIINLSNAISDLNAPISIVQSQLPAIQTSVDALAPQISLMIQAQFKTQMEEIKLSFQAAEFASTQRRNPQTSELLSRLSIDDCNPVQTIYKLASKPSALTAVANSLGTCQCRARRLYSRRMFKLGPLCLTDTASSDIPHYKDCDFYSADLKSSRTQALRFTGLTGLIGKAIEITFCSTKGAGAFSISPSIVYFAIVDEDKAPAFRAISLVGTLIGFLQNQEYRERVLREGIWKLKEIFRDGKGRPTDINDEGDSLLHKLAHDIVIYGGLTRRSDNQAHSLFQFLVNIGVPTDALGAGNCLAFHIAGSRLSAPASVLRLLLAEDADISHPPVAPTIIPTLFINQDNVTMYDRENPKLIEALFEPLGVAIVRNDVRRVADLVRRYPEQIGEVNGHCGTYCSMAIENPAILKLIVDQASPLQLVERSRTIWGEITPLGKAMRLSGKICENRKGTNESPCPCIAAVKILLDTECPIIPHIDLRPRCFGKASEHCKALVAQELRNRRRELRSLAREKLSLAENCRFRWSTTELDYEAKQLDRLLYQKKFHTFGRLSTVAPTDMACVTTDKWEIDSIFRYLATPEDASIFWELGFRDMSIDRQYCLDHNVHVWNSENYNIFDRPLSPSYALWLIDHCPCLWQLICQQHRLKGSDFILADIVGCYNLMEKHHWAFDAGFPHVATIIGLPTTESTDSCNCQCSTKGCKPFDLLLKWLMMMPQWLKELVPQRGRKRLLTQFLEKYSKVLDLDQHTAIVRQTSFQALDMQHTCVNRPRHSLQGFDQHYDDDKDEAFDERDLEKGDHLDSLASEFKDFMLRECKITDYMTTNETPSRGGKSGDRSIINYQRVLEFWNDIWPIRIQQIKEELEAGWNPKLQVLNDLGISLRYEGGDEEKIEEHLRWVREYLDQPYSFEDREALEFREFKEELDRIY
ncbi:hypothetical protein FHETE_5583 [Fusarium heterosporum]|uniref:Fungal N-terminal domain-containing protein n=1 Tax=Fusarium heterosporum TaxID=42747 RepID=A0A8H5TEV8_FUSHE|nr:hypothetical protein FHETE_5583 [Fusarium heterosporum]